MSDELTELQENAEHGRENAELAPHLRHHGHPGGVRGRRFPCWGHRSHTEELLMQNRATDQWAYYQAKNIRLHNYDMGLDLLPLVDFKDKDQAGKVQEKYRAQVDRYTKEQGRYRRAGQGFRDRIGEGAAQSGPI